MAARMKVPPGIWRAWRRSRSRPTWLRAPALTLPSSTVRSPRSRRPPHRACHESAGKRHSGRTGKGNRWLGGMLVEASLNVTRKSDSYYAAFYHRIAARRGKRRAQGCGRPQPAGRHLPPRASKPLRAGMDRCREVAGRRDPLRRGCSFRARLRSSGSHVRSWRPAMTSATGRPAGVETAKFLS